MTSKTKFEVMPQKVTLWMAGLLNPNKKKTTTKETHKFIYTVQNESFF